jgi:hypothetical protein
MEKQEDHDKLIRIETKLDAILVQVTRTNGRVSYAETNISNLQNWKNYIMGGLALLCLVGLPMIWLLVNDTRENKDLITKHVAQDK